MPMTPLTLSVSQLDSFAQCRRAYWLERVRRVAKAPARWFIAGRAFHTAIEADGHAAIAGAPRLNLADLVAAYRAALDRETAQDDPTGLLAQDRPRMDADGTAALAVYHARVQAYYHPVAVETPPDALDLGDGIRFTGRIDSVTEPRGPDGGLIRTIVDLKTASSPWLPGDEHRKDQATAYLMLLHGTPLAAQRVTFVTFPRQRTGQTTLDVRTTTRTPAEIAAFAARVVATGHLIRAVRASAAPPDATPGTACQFCAVQHACPVGRGWLAAQGRHALLPVLPVMEADGVTA